jgi:hypothetical protein
MKLRQIALRTTHKSTYAEKFNPESWVVPELYWTFLKDYSTPLVQQINIYISDDWKNSLTSPMKVTGFREAFIDFDFQKYFELNNYDKKKMQLEAVHKGMMQIAQQENWELNPLLDAYNSCLKANLEFKIFIKDKFKTSPNKQHSIGFWCEWDFDFCKVFWVLRDKNKIEIKRQLLTDEKPYDGEFVYYLDWKWLNDLTVEVADKYKYGRNLKWEIII